MDLMQGVEDAVGVAAAPLTGGASLMPLIAGGLGAGIGMIGQNQQNKAQEAAASSAQQFAASQTAQQEAFQTQMSNTAEQRNVADLKAAGLNPMLATGQMASTPSGGAASGQQAQQGNVIGAGVNTAMQAFSNAQAASQTNANIENTYSQAAKARADAAVEVSQAPHTYANLDQDTKNKVQAFNQANIMNPYQARQAQAGAILSESAEPEARNEARAQSGWFGKIAPYFSGASDLAKIGATIGLRAPW